MKALVANPALIIRELNNRKFYNFVKFFWSEVSSETFQSNWHIEYFCEELQKLAENLGNNKPKMYDLICNVPPGTSKTTIFSIMFPIWCWTRWYWMKFICLSYSAALALESAEKSRDIIRGDKFKMIYPDIDMKPDKEALGNFRVIKLVPQLGKPSKQLAGGSRFSTSVGGSLTGFHGHFIIWDDPLNPQQAVSKTELDTTNRWMDNTMSTRKIDKARSVVIGIMQRLNQDDPTGHILKKAGKKIRHICLPGEITNYRDKVQPPELVEKYNEDGLLDPVRLSQEALNEMEADLGQYGYAGQVGQSPTPPGGSMFKVEHINIIEKLPSEVAVQEIVRYWDKAGTKEQANNRNKPCYTVGVKIARLTGNRFVVMDVKRGRWSSEERERVILHTAQADGVNVRVYYEQEPGSGGKESAEATTRNLCGFSAQADLPRGDKIYRADPYSVQVNNGSVSLLRGGWNQDYIEELRYFPFGTFKDQVDASAGGFNKLTRQKSVVII